MILQIKPFIGLSVLFLSVFFSCGQTKKTEGLEVIPIEAASTSNDIEGFGLFSENTLRAFGD